MISGKSGREPAVLFKSHIYQLDLKLMNLIDVVIMCFFALFLFVHFFLRLSCLLTLRKILSPKDLKVRNKKYYMRTPLAIHIRLVLFFLLIFLHAVLMLSWNTMYCVIYHGKCICPTASQDRGQMPCAIKFIVMDSWYHLMRGPVEYLVLSSWR